MKFFRMIKMDFKRMFLSGKFYFAIAGAMLVTVLNISQEAMQSRWNVSVYYLVVSSHGVGAFFEVFSVLAVLPFALSYWEDSRNGYLRCIETRIGRTAYCWSHSGGCLFRFCDQYFSGNGSCLWRFGIKNTVDKKRRA